MNITKIGLHFISTVILSVLFYGNVYAVVDISDKVEIQENRMRYDRRASESHLSVNLKNISENEIVGPIYMAVRNISSSAVSVINHDRINQSGESSFEFASLSSGTISPSKEIRFSNPRRNRFSYEVVVYTEESEVEVIIKQLEFYSEINDNNDLDGDGLLNNYEINQLNLRSLPDNADSDGNGITDDQEDFDLDGLKNIEEQQYGTDPLSSDSDNDGLSDFDELIIHLTNPLKIDSDDDKLDDNDELDLGTNPTNPDSDGNGVLDGDETYETTAQSDDSSIEVAITGQGSIAKQVTVKKLEDHGSFALDTGSILPPISPIEITSEKSFDSAIIKFVLTPEIIANYDVNHLKVVYFDETLNTFIPLTNQGINLAENYIWAETTHFSIFTVIDELILNTVFNEPFNGSSRGNGEFIDIVFTLDSSGSMGWNDPQNIRRSASKTLIDALSTDDQVAVVDFDSGVRVWQTLTKDKLAAKTGIDRVNSSGGTNIGIGVYASIQQILSRGLYENKVIILLTDGQGSYSNSYTQLASANGIVIHTIGLGSGVNRSLLSGIASGTGGNYYQVSHASQLIDVFNEIRDETLDTDGDGLPDYAETNGMRIGLGFKIYTDPNVKDSDADGLSDGQEMGSVTNNPFFGGDYYLMLSNPNKEDSDSDGVKDKVEVEGSHEYPHDSNYQVDFLPKTGTNPLKSDSDGDGISDFNDRFPNHWDWYGSSLRPGDIIVVGHPLSYYGGKITDILAMYQWSHAVMYMGEEKILDSHPLNPNGGVDWSNIHEFLYNADYDRIAFLRVKNKSEIISKDASNNAFGFYRSVFEYPGWGQFESSFGSDDSLYCAELVYKSWETEGVDLRLFGGVSPFPWVRPNDIYTSIHSKRIKEIQNMPSQRP
jgi:uncharacterized protein YycO